MRIQGDGVVNKVYRTGFSKYLAGICYALDLGEPGHDLLVVRESEVCP